MTEDKPLVFHDYRMLYHNGVEEFVTVQEGRDVVDTATDGQLHFEIHHEDGALESVTIYRSQLASLRTVRREHQAELSAEQMIERLMTQGPPKQLQ